MDMDGSALWAPTCDAYAGATDPELDSIVIEGEKKKGNLIFKERKNPSKCLILWRVISQFQIILDSSELNYRNIKVKCGDGFLGWPEFSPFDGIIVTCAPEKIPLPLLEQLAEGGRLVIPVGT